MALHLAPLAPPRLAYIHPQYERCIRSEKFMSSKLGA